MIICAATPEYGSKAGGIATFYSNLALVLSESGHTIIILTINEDDATGPDTIEKKQENLIVVTLKESYLLFYNRFSINASKDALNVVSALAIGHAMKKWLKENHQQYGIEIIESVELDGIGFFLSDPDLPALVVCGHGALFQMAKYDFVMRDKRYRIITSLEKKALLHADMVITHSVLNKSSLENEFGIQVVLATAPWKPKQLITEKHPVSRGIIVVGRLQTCKGIKVIAEALKEGKKRGREIHLTWIGRDTHSAPFGSTWSKYLAKKYRSIWMKNLSWVPQLPKEEVKQIIQSAKLVIVPSVWESFNYVAIEALSSGTPLIISKGAGASYLFDNARGITVIPANDFKAIIKAIEDFDNETSDQHSLSEARTDTIDRVLSDKKVLHERISCYTTAILKRKEKSMFRKEKQSPEYMFDLNLSFIYYVRIFILKVLARIS